MPLKYSNLQLAQFAFLLLRRSTENYSGDAIDELVLYIDELEKRLEEATGYMPSGRAATHWESVARYYSVWQYLSANPNDSRAAETMRVNYEDARRKWFRAASIEHNKDYFNDHNNRRRMQSWQPNLSGDDDTESIENEKRWDENNISQVEDFFSKPPVVADRSPSVTAATPTSVFDPATHASDPESLLDLTSVVILGGPLNGTATVSSVGVITYTSNAGSGTDVIVAQIKDKSDKFEQFKIDITYS